MQKLTVRQTIIVASTLFGVFFGAGNLIFPVHLGQLAGSNFIPAAIGFMISAVGLPILGTIAVSNSNSESAFSLISKAGKPFAYFFCVLMVLTIGPFFAVPRCASTTFTMGIEPLLPAGMNSQIALLVFSGLFFAAVMFFSLRPDGISTWIGKVINPLFLSCLFVLLVVAFANPIGDMFQMEPTAKYQETAMVNGLLEGYGTMDAIISLILGALVVDVLVKQCGLKDNKSITAGVAKSGIYAAIAMCVIYFAIVCLGAQSLGEFELSDNGAIALSQICNHYFGNFGQIVLACIVLFATMKTAIGVVTCCSREFVKIFPKGPSYNVWAVIFVLASFLVSNVGLTQIIAMGVPVLAFIYPPCIAIIICSLLGRFFNFDSVVYKFAIFFTIVPAFFDFLASITKTQLFGLNFQAAVDVGNVVFPLFDIGLGWVVPFAVGFVLGLLAYRIKLSKGLASAPGEALENNSDGYTSDSDETSENTSRPSGPFEEAMVKDGSKLAEEEGDASAGSRSGKASQ